MRPSSGEHTSDTITKAATTEDLALGHSSFKSLSTEAERSVPGLNSNEAQSQAWSDVECRDDILSGGEEMFSTSVMEEELRISNQESSTTDVEEEEPWRSSRIRSKLHLKPDFSLLPGTNFKSNKGQQTQHSDILQKIECLKSMMKLF